MGITEDTLNRLKKEAFAGGLAKASKAELEQYAAALCFSQAFSFFGAQQFPQICETVRIHLLRAHIESLQAHITALDEKNTRLQHLVILLAAVAVISSGFQIYIQISPRSIPAALAPSAQVTPTTAQRSPTPPTAPGPK